MEDSRFELRGGESWRDPFGSYAELRAQAPLHHVSDGDFYVLVRFRDVWEAAGDPGTFSSASGLTVKYDELEAAGMGEAVPMVFLDPPEHTEFRRLVTKGLTPRRVADLEPEIREFVTQRLDRVADQGRADIVRELFKPLPSFVVAHYLGVPPEDRGRFDEWTEAIVSAASSGQVERAGSAFEDLLGYFATLIERRRTEPSDDIVSQLVEMGEETVSIMRILGFAFTMVTGGNDTITGMLSASACLLTEHPEARASLRDDPAAMNAAIEELLRLTSPVQNLARTVTRDVDIDGHKIPAGKKVLLCYASANRDEREFGEDSDAFRPDRPIKKMLSFSYGTHYCIGAAAARLQARVALEEILRRFPDFSVDVAAGEYADGAYVRRHLSLPFDASGGAS